MKFTPGRRTQTRFPAHLEASTWSLHSEAPLHNLCMMTNFRTERKRSISNAYLAKLLLLFISFLVWEGSYGVRTEWYDTQRGRCLWVKVVLLPANCRSRGTEAEQWDQHLSRYSTSTARSSHWPHAELLLKVWETWSCGGQGREGSAVSLFTSPLLRSSNKILHS